MKILVNIYVPAIQRKYDVFIPSAVKVKTAASLIANTVENLSNHLYVVSGEEYLCSIEKNSILRRGATLEQYGICNGDHLIMM